MTSSSGDYGRSTRYRICLTPRALTDVEAFYERIAREAPAAAERWVGELFEAVEGLALFPHRCRLALEEQVLRMGLRQLAFGDYRVLFRVDEELRAVNVLHVRHGSRGFLERGEITRQ